MKPIVIAAMAALIAGSAAPAFAQPPHHDWHKGGRIEHDDWNRGQPVDWKAHHLHRPGRGQEWRQVDGNYVLAAAATGLIAGIALAH